MRTLSRNSGPGLFLVEVLAAILIFSLAAGVCVKIFVQAYWISQENHQLTQAVFLAENCAECFKAVSGDLPQLHRFLGGHIEDSIFSNCYDEQGQPTEAEAAAYYLELSADANNGGLRTANITITSPAGELLFQLGVTALEEENAQ